jgi:putative DeoR family transcriptional regulator (stage III sporulation protein D)
MKDKLLRKVIEVAEYTIANKSTVRATAEHFGIGKSTVQVYLTKRLPQISPSLAEEVREIIAFNFSERNIRGGESMKIKYRRM